MNRSARVTLAAAIAAAFAVGAGAADAATKFYAYNMTSTTDFPGVYLAPAGSSQWGINQTVNDADRQLDMTERLTLTGLQAGTYDVMLVDTTGKTCIKRGVVLGKERSFEIHDDDLQGCH
jgi:hypothetical protein